MVDSDTQAVLDIFSECLFLVAPGPATYKVILILWRVYTLKKKRLKISIAVKWLLKVQLHLPSPIVVTLSVSIEASRV